MKIEIEEKILHDFVDYCERQFNYTKDKNIRHPAIGNFAWFFKKWSIVNKQIKYFELELWHRAKLVINAVPLSDRKLLEKQLKRLYQMQVQDLRKYLYKKYL